MSEFQAQCWICPHCFDDHSQSQECKIEDLKRAIEIIKSRASQFESTLKETMSERDKLKEILYIVNQDNDRLKRIIAKELSEDDSLGNEFVYVCALKEENKVLNEKLKIATEALEEIGNEQYHNRWDCDGGEAKCEIAREALDKLKKETEK